MFDLGVGMKYTLEYRDGRTENFDIPPVMGRGDSDLDPQALEELRRRLKLHRNRNLTPANFQYRGGRRLTRLLLQYSQDPKYVVQVFPNLDLRTATRSDILQVTELVPYAWQDRSRKDSWPAAQLKFGMYLINSKGEKFLALQGSYIIRTEVPAYQYGWVPYSMHEMETLKYVPTSVPMF
jgi:hypothetical protein